MTTIDAPAVGVPEKDTATDARAQQKADARALDDLLRPVAPSLAVGRVLAVVSAILAVVPYIALVHIGEILLDAGHSDGAVDADAVFRWLRILLAAFTLRLAVYFVALLITHLADIRLGHLLRRRMIHRFAEVPLNWFTATNSGRVRKALQDDIGTIHHLIAHRPVDGTVAIVMPLTLTVYAFVIDWRLGLLAVATVPLYGAAMALSIRGMGEKTVLMDTKLAVVSARMVEFVTGITVVKAFGRVGHAHRAYRESAEEFQVFYHDWVRPLVRVSSLGTSLLAVPLILLVNIGGGAWLVHHGAVTVADVLATSLIALLIPYGIEVLMNAMWSAQIAGAAARRLTDLLETPVLADDGVRAEPRGHDVVFDHVGYTYGTGESAELALDDVSFTLREGTVTALVGPSGSGKSTIAALLARFDDPQSGEIRLGGVPVSEIDHLYRHVGFVLQDPQLPAISLRDNIALGRPDATEEQLRETARAARILDEIEAYRTASTRSTVPTADCPAARPSASRPPAPSWSTARPDPRRGDRTDRPRVAVPDPAGTVGSGTRQDGAARRAPTRSDHRRRPDRPRAQRPRRRGGNPRRPRVRTGLHPALEIDHRHVRT